MLLNCYRRQNTKIQAGQINYSEFRTRYINFRPDTDRVSNTNKKWSEITGKNIQSWQIKIGLYISHKNMVMDPASLTTESLWITNNHEYNLIESLWAVTGVNVRPEHRILVRHVFSNFTACIIARNLGVTLSLANPADNFGLIVLDYGVASDIEPEEIGRIEDPEEKKND